MPLASEDSKIAHAGDGVSTVFAYPYKFNQNSDLKVLRRVLATGIESVVLPVGFAGAGDEDGGSVTLASPPVVGEQIWIYRDPPATQTTDYQENDAFPAASHEAALDKVTMLVQRLRDRFSRTLVAAETDVATGPLPSSVARANKLLAFDSNGNPQAIASVLGTATQLALDLLSSIGSSMIGFIQAGVGAVARLVQDKLRDTVSAKDFGAVCDGVTDDTVAIQAALDSGARKVYLPGNTVISAKLTIPATTTLAGMGLRAITKAFNGDMIDMSAAYCRMEDIELQGAGGTRTGRGIVISGTSGGDQVIDRCNVLNMNGYCLEVTTNDGAPRLTVRGGTWQRITATNPAIKLPAADSITFGQRDFIGLFAAGGALFDLAGASLAVIMGCNFVAHTTLLNSSSHSCILIGNRIVGPGSPVTIGGQGHLFQANVFGPDIVLEGSLHHFTGNNMAGTVTIQSGVSQLRIRGNNHQGTVTDNSRNVTNHLEYTGSFTPVWGADSSPPAIGNGSLNGRLIRDGKKLRLIIQLTFGSTTTAGTGAYFFTLPAPFDTLTVGGSGTVTQLGSLRVSDNGGNVYAGRAVVTASPIKIYAHRDNVAANVGPTQPITFATGDSIQIDIEVELG